MDAKQFDVEIYQSTKIDWNQVLMKAREDVNPDYYSTALEKAERFVEGKHDKNTFVYALIDPLIPLIAQAILHLSHAMPNRESAWLKVLNFYPHPKFNFELDPSLNEQLAEIAIQALLHVFRLTSTEHPAAKFKMYASYLLTKEFLLVLARKLQDNGDWDIDVSSHGNWIVISKGKRG